MASASPIGLSEAVKTEQKRSCLTIRAVFRDRSRMSRRYEGRLRGRATEAPCFASWLPHPMAMARSPCASTGAALVRSSIIATALRRFRTSSTMVTGCGSSHGGDPGACRTESAGRECNAYPTSTLDGTFVGRTGRMQAVMSEGPNQGVTRSTPESWELNKTSRARKLAGLWCMRATMLGASLVRALASVWRKNGWS